MTTINKFKILTKFVKDMSSETPDVQSFLFVKDNISKYHLNIEIKSKPLKSQMIEVSAVLKFADSEANEKKAHFEIDYASIIKVDEDVKEKKELEKIILCDVPKEIYPDLEKIFLNLLKDSGYPEIKVDKKIDFDKLYKEKFN